MNEKTIQSWADRIVGWIRDHQKSVYVLRHIGVYGGKLFWAVVKATILAVAAGMITSMVLTGFAWAIRESMLPELKTDDVSFTPFAEPIVLVGVLTWIFAMIVYVYRAGRGQGRITMRTGYGTDEQHMMFSSQSRARELVLQAIVARHMGTLVHSIEMPIDGIGQVNHSFYQVGLPTSRDRLVAACAFAIAGDALGQDHAVLDWAIVADATSDAPLGFTRDELIRKAAVVVAQAKQSVPDALRQEIERELRYLGQISTERLDELLGAAASSHETIAA